jgi:hypothetical protein
VGRGGRRQKEAERGEQTGHGLLVILKTIVSIESNNNNLAFATDRLTGMERGQWRSTKEENTQSLTALKS